MTEKRFRYYEHKGADYILDTPNESLDFIEMLGDCLEAEEVVDLLNALHEENQNLTKANLSFGNYIEELEKENRQLKGRIQEYEEIDSELIVENKKLKEEHNQLLDKVVELNKVVREIFSLTGRML